MSVTSSQRLRITVSGTVQGVGFRPFVHRLAQHLHLVGWVANTADGALVEVEGSTSKLNVFLERLSSEAPPTATIKTVATQLIPEEGQVGFSIRSSDLRGSVRLVVSADLATCNDCGRELEDPTDRRFRYPFLTCTQCGPRYSVVTDLPYDRSRTTMDQFPLCTRCQTEYDDPSDRRYHAESVACPACGPHIAFWNDSGQTVAKGEVALEHACAALREGNILAVKGLGGFQLWVDARSESAVQRLRFRKQRPHKPFAVLFPSLAAVRAACIVSPHEERCLSSPQAPIVVVPRGTDAQLAEAIAPGNTTVGAMLPYTPLHILLMGELQFPVIATSGNRSDEPIATDEAEACERLAGIADAFLVHNRPIARAVDDSVVRFVGDQPLVLRRARGYAPLPVYIKEEVRNSRPLPPILGVGGHLKNTISMSLGDQILLSQHIGDLSTVESLRAFRGAVEDLQALAGRKPVAVACDLHPDYRSSLFAANLAKSLQLPLLKTQHHHAHVAACMAEHGLNGEVLGVAWDGSGYGPDGTLWGGEFLVAGYGSFTRVAHLLPFPLPGGEQAAREPRRSALSLLWETVGEQIFSKDWRAVRGDGPVEQSVTALLRNGAPMPLTTSMGRLFDGVASITGVCQVASFEGQGAIALQLAAERGGEGVRQKPDTADARYPIPLRNFQTEPGLAVADWRPLIQQISYDLSKGMSPMLIAYSFHQALADLVQRVAERAALPRVVLTGGCFQNVLLVRLVRHRLEEAGFTVYTHQQVPPNDGGLALGQVTIAAHQLVMSKGSGGRGQGRRVASRFTPNGH